LIPLSKFRTLDNRLGGNATDGNVQDLRSFTRDVIAHARQRFDRIIVTYRGSEFGSDPLGIWLASESDAKIEVKSAKDAPAGRMLSEVDAVLWDVTATGLFETLHCNVPTVALFQRGRWAKDAAWAEQLMRRHDVGVETADEAASSLIKFVDDPDAWRDARRGIQPVLDEYAAARPDWRAQWHDFLEQLGHGLPDASGSSHAALMRVNASPLQRQGTVEVT
jgi:hypothetical protein